MQVNKHSQLFLSGRTDRTDQLAYISVTDELTSAYVGFSSGMKYPGKNNTFYGSNSGRSTKQATFCTLVGSSCGVHAERVATCVALGSEAFRDATDSSGCVVIGTAAGQLLRQSSLSVAVGHQALSGVARSSRDVVVGALAGRAARNISNVVLTGFAAGSNGVNITDTVSVGATSLRDASDIQFGTYVGYGSGSSGSGFGSTMVGANSGQFVSAGNTTLVGFGAGKSFGVYENVVAVGARAMQDSSGSLSNNTVMGSEAGQYLQGNSNTILGCGGGKSVRGNNNSFFGAEAGVNIAGNDNVLIGTGLMGIATNVSNCSVIGQNIVPVDSTLEYSNSVYIGSNLSISASEAKDTVVIGIGNLRYLTGNATTLTTLGTIRGKTWRGNVISTSVGIGTEHPLAPLHIDSGMPFSSQPTAYLRYFPETDVAEIGSETSQTQVPVSILAKEGIVGSHFLAFSDTRVKRDIVAVDAGAMASFVANIGVVSFRYRDQVRNGSRTRWGFTAQDLEAQGGGEHVVSHISDYLPSIYQRAKREGSEADWFTLPTPHTLQVGDRVKLILASGPWEGPVVDITPTSFQVRDCPPNNKKVFVYGHKTAVKIVDHDSLLAATVAALQHTQRRVDRLEKMLLSKNGTHTDPPVPSPVS